jgi:hypothetical protein
MVYCSIFKYSSEKVYFAQVWNNLISWVNLNIVIEPQEDNIFVFIGRIMLQIENSERKSSFTTFLVKFLTEQQVYQFPSYLKGVMTTILHVVEFNRFFS